MPTKRQVYFLEQLVSGKFKKKHDPHKYSVYKKRIRERIDQELSSLKWVANNYPEILTDEEYEITEYGNVRHARLKLLMEIVKAIYPEADPVLVKYRKDIGLVSQ